MTPLDQQIIDEIRELALTDTKKLIELYIDADKLKICRQRKMDKTLQQIATSMRMSKKKVWKVCQTCPE